MKALALTVLLATDALAQGELERLGGGPGGVPQGGAWSAERAGNAPRRRRKASPAPAPSPAPQPSASPEAEENEAPDISWTNGLLSVDCENVHVGEFLLELHRQTSIPIHLEPGVEHRVTAKFTGLRLERALPMLFPEGTWQVVRKPGTALRAEDAVAGLVVRPQNATAKARVGGMNFGPAFAIPGEVAATPPAGDLPVEASVEPPPPVTASASPEPAPSVASVAATPPATPAAVPSADDGEAPRKKIAELLEQRRTKK